MGHRCALLSQWDSGQLMFFTPVAYLAHSKAGLLRNPHVILDCITKYDQKTLPQWAWLCCLLKLNGNLFKYDTPQEDSFKEKAQQAVYHFHARHLQSLPPESTGGKPGWQELKCDGCTVSLSRHNESYVLEFITWWSLLNTNQPSHQGKGMGVGGKEISSVDSRQQCIWDSRVMQAHQYSVCGRVPLIH